MSGGSFLNIKASKELLERLDNYRIATRKPSRAAAARELLDRVHKAFFEVSSAEPVRPGDPDYALVRPAPAAGGRLPHPEDRGPHRL